jgi:hypothetical protein
MTYILGIDPGITGAYVVIARRTKRIKVCKLFTNFETVLEDVTPYLGKVVACLEKVSAMPNQGAKSTATFMKNAGAWEGFLVALQIPYTLVPPQTWQKSVLDTQPPKKTLTGANAKKILNENRKLRKLHITSFVLRNLPRAQKYFKLKKDQDKADAICIALYKRKQMGYHD